MRRRYGNGFKPPSWRRAADGHEDVLKTQRSRLLYERCNAKGIATTTFAAAAGADFFQMDESASRTRKRAWFKFTCIESMLCMFQSGIDHHHQKISSGASSVLVGYAELGAVRLSVVIPRKYCFTFVIVINRPLEFWKFLLRRYFFILVRPSQ